MDLSHSFPVLVKILISSEIARFSLNYELARPARKLVGQGLFRIIR